MKIRPVAAEILHAERRTEEEMDMTEITVAPGNFAFGLKNHTNLDYKTRRRLAYHTEVSSAFAYSCKVPITFDMSIRPFACNRATATGRIYTKFDTRDFLKKLFKNPNLIKIGVEHLGTLH